MNNDEIMDISNFDFFICTIITLFSVVYTVILTRRNNDNSLESYMLFGRKLTLPLFVATLVSTWYGDIFGVTQLAYQKGIYGIFAFGVPFYLSALFFMIFFVEKARKIKAFSIPDIFEKLYSKKTAKLSAIMIIIESLPVTYAMGIGVLIKNLTGLELHYSIIAGVLIVILYIGIKGFGGIIYSDAIQFILMFSAAIAVVVVSYINYGGISFLRDKLDPIYFNIQQDYSTLLIWLLLGFITTIMSPVFYQRCFAAKSDAIAKKGIFISIIFWMLFDLMSVLGAMYAKAVMSDSNPGEAYFLYCIQTLPTGIKGLYLAGIIATILSTLDSFLFINSSTILIDLFGKGRGKEYILKILSLIFSGILTILLSLNFFNNIEEYYLKLRSYSVVPIVFPLLIVILFKKFFSEKQILFSMISTILIMLFNDFFFVRFKSFYIGCVYNIIIFLLFSIKIYYTKIKYYNKSY